MESRCRTTQKNVLKPIYIYIYIHTYIHISSTLQLAALKFGSEAWVLKKREEQRLEAAQMKFLRHLLGITKLDKEKAFEKAKTFN